MSEANWYVVHTYSGYENKVKADIEKTIENRKLQDMILEVSVPMQNVMEEKADGEEKLVQKKLFPAYVLINMVMNDETWYVVRNTRGVTGFVGPGSKPVPLTDAEVEKMGVEVVRMAEIGVAVGDMVNVKSGPMEGFSGVVEAVDEAGRKVRLKIDMFGKESTLEIDANQVVLAD